MDSIFSLKEEHTTALLSMAAFVEKKYVFAVLPTGFGKSVIDPNPTNLLNLLLVAPIYLWLSAASPVSLL